MYTISKLPSDSTNVRCHEREMIILQVAGLGPLEEDILEYSYVKKFVRVDFNITKSFMEIGSAIKTSKVKIEEQVTRIGVGVLKNPIYPMISLREILN